MRPPGPPPRKSETVFESLDAIRTVLAKRGTVENVFRYADPDSQRVDLAVFRIRTPEGKKTFIQASPQGAGFVLKAPPKPWPLYNRTRLREASEVIVVEGEKCVHALHSIGIIGTTSPAGAGKAACSDWTPLSGKTVILWPDHDAAGVSHMKDVAGILEKLDPAPVVMALDPEALDLPEKGDAADLVARLTGTPEEKGKQVWRILAQARPIPGAASDVRERLEETISGKWRAGALVMDDRDGRTGTVLRKRPLGIVMEYAGERIRTMSASAKVKPGEEAFENFCSYMDGRDYVQYDYGDTDGELFSTIERTLEIARERRDEWLKKREQDRRRAPTRRSTA